MTNYIINWRGHMKTCIKCRLDKDEEQFYFYGKEKKGRINTCKSCHKEIMTKWQNENPDKCKQAWTKFNRKRNKGRICKHCGRQYKIATAQEGCSTYCRFQLGHQKKENGCWEWIKGKVGKKKQQYGGIWIAKKHRKASHISYELYKGEITSGMMVLHTCDNSVCVNPDHLYLGTHQQNMNDMNQRGRGNAGKIRFRKYDKEICVKAVELRKDGKLFREIADILNIRESACKYICKHEKRLYGSGAT